MYIRLSRGPCIDLIIRNMCDRDNDDKYENVSACYANYVHVIVQFSVLLSIVLILEIAAAICAFVLKSQVYGSYTTG